MANLNTALTWDKKVFQGIDVTFKWNNAPSKPPHRESNRTRYTWDEVKLLVRAAGDDYTQWVDHDKKKLVKLTLKVHGNTITEEKQKEIKQFKIKVSDVKLAIEKISSVEVITENIKL